MSYNIDIQEEDDSFYDIRARMAEVRESLYDVSLEKFPSRKILKELNGTRVKVPLFYRGKSENKSIAQAFLAAYNYGIKGIFSNNLLPYYNKRDKTYFRWQFSLPDNVDLLLKPYSKSEKYNIIVSLFNAAKALQLKPEDFNTAEFDKDSVKRIEVWLRTDNRSISSITDFELQFLLAFCLRRLLDFDKVVKLPITSWPNFANEKVSGLWFPDTGTQKISKANQFFESFSASELPELLATYAEADYSQWRKLMRLRELDRGLTFETLVQYAAMPKGWLAELYPDF